RRRATDRAKNRRGAAGDSRRASNFLGKTVEGRRDPDSVQGRSAVVFAAGVNLKAALQPGEAAAVEIVFETVPRIESAQAAQVSIAEDHPAEMGQVRDAALTGGIGRIERDGADDPNKVLHLDRKK